MSISVVAVIPSVAKDLASLVRSNPLGSDSRFFASLRMTRLVRSEEGSNVSHDFTPRTDLAPSGGKPLQQPTPVRLRHDAWIRYENDAAVGSAANQATESLLQSERGVWEHVVDESTAALRGNGFAVRRGHGLGRHAKGKLREH